MVPTSPPVERLSRSFSASAQGHTSSLRPGMVAACLALFLALGACGLPFPPWAPGPVTFVEPPWDSISPPPIVAGVPLDSFPEIEIGRPVPMERNHAAIDVVHYEVELVLPPENDRISQHTTVRYLRPQTGPHQATLDLEGLTVERVTARGIPIEFVHERGLLTFQHPGVIGIYDTVQVEIMARGRPQDGLILRNNVHGSPTAFSDNWPNRARFWFPSNDHPSDKATVAFTVHVPPSRMVVANGERMGNPFPSPEGRTGGVEGLMAWRWESRVPIPTYLMVIGVAEFEVRNQGLASCGQAPTSPREDGCVELSAWAFPPDIAHAEAVFGRSGAMLELYADRFGPYPFEKLAHVQSSTRFGGMENASTIFYSEQALAQRRDIEGTVAHEIAHQWFGNWVTPADWPHLWLSEGFASYFGPYFWQITEGDLAFRQRIDGIRSRVLTSSVIDRPVVDEWSTNLLDLLNANSYQKGAMVLHTLRGVVGERAFFGGIRRYLQRHGGGVATTADFQRAMEEELGDSLDWFFRQWLHRPGFPSLHTRWSWDPATRQALISISQIQSEAWPAFRLLMDFEFQMNGGVHRAQYWVDGREWEMRVPLPQPPLGLRLDPDGWQLMEVRVVDD